MYFHHALMVAAAAEVVHGLFVPLPALPLPVLSSILKPLPIPTIARTTAKPTTSTTKTSTTKTSTTTSTTKTGTSTSASTSTSTTKTSLTTSTSTSATSSVPTTIVPKRMGVSGYIGFQNTAAFAALAPYIGWYSDYSSTTPTVGNVQGFPMLWGAGGSVCDGTANTVNEYTLAVANSTPKVMQGFYEPDCFCPDSSQMTFVQAQAAWNLLLAPLGAKGTTLLSPSMCKQLDEDFLTPFMAGITRMWDVTSIHVNVVTLDLVKADVEYYRNKYGKPIFVSEFACVEGRYGGWVPCTNQTQINQFISDTVQYFNSQPDIVGYGPSNGNGLGTAWPLVTSTGALSATGQAYLNAIKSL